jgi:hypothetical protein
VIKLFSILAALLFLVLNAYTQNVESQASKVDKVGASYNRNAVTVLVLDNNNKYIDNLKKAATGVIIPSKYDNNLLETRYIAANPNSKSIEQALSKQKLPNEILSKWFSRQPSGQFDMSVIYERGMYNATDDEVKKASASKIGMAKLKDAGEILISHSYILVLEFNKIESLTEKFDRQDAYNKEKAKKSNTTFEPIKRRKNGYEGEVKGFLYRLNFNDSIMNVFYNDLWIYEDDDDATIASKREKFDNTEFPISFVMSADGTADGAQYNPGEFLAPSTQLTKEELFQKMINSGMNSILFDVERKVEEFRVKTPLYSTKPLKAKVGKKEGLYSEQRFFAYEFVQKRNGETKAKRKGVVRAKQVVDNRKVATGESNLYTTFYQTSGLGLMEGMFLQQRNDFGIGVSSGIALNGEMGGVYVKAEANLGVLSGMLLGQDLGINQFKVYVVGALQTKEYVLASYEDMIGITDDFDFTRLQVGISKGWYFANNFSIAPFIGYGTESGTSEDWRNANFTEDDGQSIGTDMIHYGVYSTINILHCFQVVGTLNMNSIIGTTYDKDRVEIDGRKYNEVFKNRSGMSLELGLRLEF